MRFMIFIALGALFEEDFCQEQVDANFIILHTNDIHGWIDGHRHIPELDADIVDYYNFVRHTKELLTNHIVLAFDSGDQTQGTGLSDLTQIPGEFIFEMLKQVPIDGFTIGNHEMYNNSCIDNIANKVQIEMKGRYIVSNSHHIDQNKKLGEKYKIMDIKGFGSILVLGYIFSFTGYMDHAYVTPVPDSIKEEWLKDVLNNKQQLEDESSTLKLVILLIHCDPANPETDLIVNQIREYRPDLPILVLGGHSHDERIVMKTHQIESQKNDGGKDIRIESLCYLQEFGLLQFSISYDNNTENQKINKINLEKLNDIHTPYRVYNPYLIKQQYSIQSNKDDNKRINIEKSNVNGFISSIEIDFIRSQVQYMQSALKSLSRLDQPRNVSDKIIWDYSESEMMRQQIEKKNEELRINEVVGCSDQTYGNDITDKITLFDLLTNKVYPKLKPFNRDQKMKTFSDNDDDNDNNIIISTAYILNSGSQRSPLYQGEVTKDDIISVDPLGNTFCAFRGVNGQDMRNLINSKIKTINKESNDQDVIFTDHYIITNSVVELIKDKDKDSNHEYDIVTSSYDCPRISEIFQSLNTSTGNGDIKYPIYDSDIILLSILKEYVIKYMKCSNSKTSLFGWIIAIIIILLVIAIIIIIALLLFIFWHRIRSNRTRTGLADDVDTSGVENVAYQQI